MLGGQVGQNVVSTEAGKTAQQGKQIIWPKNDAAVKMDVAA